MERGACRTCRDAVVSDVARASPAGHGAAASVPRPVRSTEGYGTLSFMTQKAVKPPIAVEEVERDPIFRALDDAPMNEIDDTDEERAELDARREEPLFVPGSVVSKELEKRRRHRGEG